MMKTALTPADLVAQTVLALPDRELMHHSLVRVGNITVGDITALQDFLNDWNVDANIDVGDVLSDNAVDVSLDDTVDVGDFCVALAAVIARATCSAR